MTIKRRVLKKVDHDFILVAFRVRENTSVRDQLVIFVPSIPFHSENIFCQNVKSLTLCLIIIDVPLLS